LELRPSCRARKVVSLLARCCSRGSVMAPVMPQGTPFAVESDCIAVCAVLSSADVPTESTKALMAGLPTAAATDVQSRSSFHTQVLKAARDLVASMEASSKEAESAGAAKEQALHMEVDSQQSQKEHMERAHQEVCAATEAKKDASKCAKTNLKDAGLDRKEAVKARAALGPRIDAMQQELTAVESVLDGALRALVEGGPVDESFKTSASKAVEDCVKQCHGDPSLVACVATVLCTPAEARTSFDTDAIRFTEDLLKSRAWLLSKTIQEEGKNIRLLDAEVLAFGALCEVTVEEEAAAAQELAEALEAQSASVTAMQDIDVQIQTLQARIQEATQEVVRQREHTAKLASAVAAADRLLAGHAAPLDAAEADAPAAPQSAAFAPVDGAKGVPPEAAEIGAPPIEG